VNRFCLARAAETIDEGVVEFNIFLALPGRYLKCFRAQLLLATNVPRKSLTVSWP
jgi:hypothetical protein